MTADEKFRKELDDALALDAQPHVTALRRFLNGIYNPAAMQLQTAYARTGVEQWPPVQRPSPGRHQRAFTRVWEFVQALEEGELKPRP